MLFTLDQLNDATAVVREAMLPTPQYHWPQLSEETGCQVWVKHENHTPTGAFKVRGGLVYLKELTSRGERPQLITATRGNHGQSIPYAAARYGVPVTVLVPEGNSVEKNAAMRAWGASVETFGADFDVARVEAERRAVERGLTLVPSFHPALVRGVATYALELFQAAPDLDVVYVPVGMGSGICGVITVRDLLGLSTEVVGVVSTHAPAMALSVAAGRIVETNSANTFADGVACRVPMPAAFDVIRQGAARIVQVSEDEVA
ncbi:MAG: threonine dehydratase, partial [Proteobacteria bacterium]|nr:threonine dehydratase [Pseudomonadota bacterium]